MKVPIVPLLVGCVKFCCRSHLLVSLLGLGLTFAFDQQVSAEDPIFACCLPSGSCAELTEADCNAALNGTLVPNGGFENPTVQNYEIAPTGSNWNYSGNSGIAANGSALTSGNPPAPEGSQVGFVQDGGSLWQAAAVGAGTYKLTLKAAQASGNQTYQQLRVNLRPSPGPTSVKTFVWSGNVIAEERDSTGANVTKRFFAEGEQRVTGTMPENITTLVTISAVSGK